MKKELRTSVPALKLKSGTYEGGFAALPAEQLMKLRGGSITLNVSCPTNTNCSSCPPPPISNNCGGTPPPVA